VNAAAPLAVALPLVVAAAVAATGHWLPAKVANLVATATAAAVTALSLVLLFASHEHDVVYWFGGWHPRDGVAIGVSFTVDPIAAGLAALAAFLMVCALVASWSFFREHEVGPLFYTLMLVFLAGLVGFSITGDLFDMFVFFELMGVAAYALTGYRVQEPGVLQGAINFAITNSVAGFMILFGIGLLYGRTSALNLSQLGEALAGRRADALVVAAFVLIVVGFLIKAAAMPFHFWLADAYAVAPAPVCVLLAGVMSDLGLHAVGRIYWEVFAGTLGGPGATAVRVLLVAVGAATAVGGAVMCLLEPNLKRLLAFVTISHGGIFLAGIGLLRQEGLAGASAYVETDGLLKGALFLAVGATVHRLGGADELRLHGRGRRWSYAPLAAVFGVAAVGLAGMPPFGPFVAKALIERSAMHAGFGWLQPVIAAATLACSAAVLRATGRIFLGLGSKRDALLRAEEGRQSSGEPEESPPQGLLFGTVLGPAAAMIAIALGVAFVPRLAGHANIAAARLMDHHARAKEVLHGIAPPRPPEAHDPALGTWRYALGTASTLGAFLLAGLLLYRHRLPSLLRRALRPLGSAVPPLRALHDGAVGDYVAYIVLGSAVFSAVWGLALR
jgi:multicomponent Na+:H+ antiporter subunit D